MAQEGGTFIPENEIPDPGNTSRLKTVGIIVGGMGLAMVVDHAIKAINEGDLLKAAPVVVGLAFLGIGKAYVDASFERSQIRIANESTVDSQFTHNTRR